MDVALFRLITDEVDPMFRGTALAVSKVGAMKLVSDLPAPDIQNTDVVWTEAFWF